MDDDAGIRQFVEKVLVRDGHDVVLAADSVQAMRALDASEFSVVLTDVVMPEADGLELIRMLRKRPSAPKVVAMSGGGRGAGAQYLEIAANLGAVATITKPFTVGELTSTIRQLDVMSSQAGS